MNNAVATAAQITTHAEYVEFYNRPEHISDVARVLIPADVLEQAQAGDYLAQLLVAGEVKNVMRLEAMTDEALRAEYDENKAGHRRAIELDGPEYDVNDHNSYYDAQWAIEEVLADREVKARYSSPQALTHSPFAGLVAA